MSSIKNVLGIAVAIIAFIAYSSYFVVDERQKALVLRFGEINRSVEKPGLYFKVPFADSVTFIEDRAGYRQSGVYRECNYAGAHF